jgi:signal transduction histidine kinase
VDLGSLVAAVTTDLRAEAHQAGCALTVRTNGTIRGEWDAERIEQVLVNLIANAIKFGAGRPIEVALHAAPGEAQVLVTDHGVGISPEDQQRIFGRFERASASRHFAGLGLGLWISARIAEAHAGALTVTSQPGQGATFVLTLPVPPRSRG